MSSTEVTALHLEAGIAAVHASAATFEATDWPALAHYYDALIELKPTPVVRLNAAIVRGFAEGAAAGLTQLDALAGNARLEGYAPYHAARSDLLLRLGRRDAAGQALQRALECPVNGAERDYLRLRLRACRVQGVTTAGTPAAPAHSTHS
jgi:RNA polymerase sigma-70 factor (ECF subfamily)